jgi:hypothetical protein
MRPFDIRNINTLNTYEWSRCNNDSKCHFWRTWVCQEYGGEFVPARVGKSSNWLWKSPPEEEMAKWVFYNPEGEKIKVSNFIGFCKKNNLDDARMYDTYTGKRKQHKGWKATRLYGIEGKKNPRDFGRNLGRPARS